MKGKTLVIIIILLLLFGIGGYFVVSKKDSSTTGKSMDADTSQEAGSKQNSLKSLLMAGVPQSCTFSSTSEGYTSEGTVYTASGKMRGDFSSVVGDKEMKSHMIVMDNTSYIWTDGETKGYKAAFTDEQKAEAEEMAKDAPKPTGGVDLDAMVDYNCKPWIVTSSHFELPAGVTFMSLEDMMGDIQKQMGTQCGACDQLTGDSKTQCLTMLKCN